MARCLADRQLLFRAHSGDIGLLVASRTLASISGRSLVYIAAQGRVCCDVAHQCSS